MTTTDTYTTNAYASVSLNKQGYVPINAVVISNDATTFINLSASANAYFGYVYKLVNGLATGFTNTQVTINVTWIKRH